MKKVISVILCILMPLFVTNCAKGTEYRDTVVSNEINYNNIYDSSKCFWVNGNDFYYGEDGFYNMRFFCHNENGTKKLFDEIKIGYKTSSENAEGFSSFLQPVGDDLYFWFNNGEYQLFLKYKKSDNSLKQIIKKDFVPDVWTVLEDKLVYYKNRNVFVYDIKTKKEMLIAEFVCGCGVVENKIRCILNNYKSGYKELYEYELDTKSQKVLGRLGKTSINETTAYNFTKNYVVFYEDESSDLFVYSIKDNSLLKYPFNNQIERISCCNKYSFIVLKIDDKKNKIIHFKLSDGSSKTLKELNSDNQEFMSIHTVSDYIAYIETLEQGKILYKSVYYKLSSNGNLERLNLK